jgi:hypothetical protein
MRRLNQTLGFLAAVIVVAVIAAFAAPKRAHALVAALVQIVPSTTTHVGQNESQMVSLLCQKSQSYCVENDPSGNASASAYVVPSGYTLVITDYEWTVIEGPTPNVLVSDSLGNNAARGLTLVVSTGAIADSNGSASSHDHYTTGIRVASGVTIFDFDAGHGIAIAQVQGYLVPND